MSSTISVTFACSVCTFVIRGEYELEDFDYPVFCPKCGRQNRLPDRPTIAPDSPLATTPTSSPAASPDPTLRKRVAWRFRPPSMSRPVVALRNCVAVDDRSRIIAALGADLFALVPGSTGCEVAWRYVTGDHIPGSPAIGANDVVSVHSSDGMLHAVDLEGSPVRSPTKVGSALGFANPLVDESQRVWVCASSGGLLRVDATGQTGTRLFFRCPNRFDSTGALRGDVLYIGCEDQFLHAIDLQSERGRDRWNQPEKIGLTGWCINSAIALDGPRIIVAGRDDHLYSFDETGVAVWKTPLDGRAIGSPVIAPNGLIVIGLTVAPGKSLTGQLVALRSQTGRLAWRVEVDAPVESTPVIGDGDEIYFGDNGGKVHAVNGQGQRLWSESVGSAVRSAGAIVPTGHVVFGLDDGSLVALRCSSKSLGGPWPKLLATPANRCPFV